MVVASGQLCLKLVLRACAASWESDANKSVEGQDSGNTKEAGGVMDVGPIARVTRKAGEGRGGSDGVRLGFISTQSHKGSISIVSIVRRAIMALRGYGHANPRQDPLGEPRPWKQRMLHLCPL